MSAVLFLGIGIAALVQLITAQQMQELGVPFNFVLAVIVFSGYFYAKHRAIAYAALGAGLVLDAYSGAPFGAITAGLLAATGATAVFSRGIPREHFLHFLLYATMGAVSFYGTVLVVMKIADLSSRIPWVGAVQIVAFNIAGSACIYGIYRWSILLKKRKNGR